MFKQNTKKFDKKENGVWANLLIWLGYLDVVGSATKIKAGPHCGTLLGASKEEYSKPHHLFSCNPSDLSCLILIMWFSCNTTNFCCLTTSLFVIESPSSLKRQGTKTPSAAVIPASCASDHGKGGFRKKDVWSNLTSRLRSGSAEPAYRAALTLADAAVLWSVWLMEGGLGDLQRRALMPPADVFISVLLHEADDQDRDGIQLDLQDYKAVRLSRHACRDGWPRRQILCGRGCWWRLRGEVVQWAEMFEVVV